MIPLRIATVGLCAAGLAAWPAARDLLAGDVAPGLDAPKPAAARLPATERRRANATSRWAIEAASEAVAALAPEAIASLATVFASADGDGDVLATMLRDLARDKVALSPTTFHNSVFNAPAGYWSIATRAPSPSTTLCAGPASFAAGLLEAASEASAARAPVLLVACDLPFPADAPIRTTADQPFACALLLTPDGSPGDALGILDRFSFAPTPPEPLEAPLAHFAGNAAAAGLPLLSALARRRAGRVTLPYLDGGSLVVELAPWS